jgi:hypothetical protein
VKLPLLSLVLGALFVLVPITVEAKTYENDRYTFEYPNSCKIEEKENRFTTTDAILECKGEAGLQFESDTETSESLTGSSDEDLVDNLENVFESGYENAGIVETGTDKYIINNYTAPFIIGTYDQEFSNAFGLTKIEPYVLMEMVVKLHDDEMVLLQYRNTEDDFDKDLPMAEKILQSVKPIAPTEGNAQKGQISDEQDVTNITNAGNSTEMAVFVNECIQNAKNEHDIESLKGIKSFVDADSYARSYMDQSCDEEIKWFDKQQNDIDVAVDNLGKTLEEAREALGLN